MLENGRMGRLRRVFEVVFGCNVLNRLFFRGIRGLRPANLECVTPVDDNVERVIEHKKKTTIIFKGLDGVRQYAVLFEQCVQSSTRVRKVQVVTRQTKHIRNLLPQCASDATGFLSDVYKKSTRARKFLADGVQCGRSMIEMLGVLAIVAVLSVGGIAGYSKAMEKWRINKLMEEYSYMIQGILGHLTEFQKLPRNTGLVDVGLAMNFIPSNWKKINPLLAYDTFGNVVKPYARDKRVVIDFYLGGLSDGQKSKGFSPRICAAIMKDLVKPLHSSLTYAWIFRGGFVVTDYFRGDTRCTSNATCLRDITPDDINRVCNLCDGERQCSITIEF